MEFNKIKEAIKKVGPDIMRIDDDNYFEAVMRFAQLDEMVRVLEGIFGSPAWPSGNKLLKEVEKLVKNFGGLRKGQTLYMLSKEGFSAFAMLWPWQDGERITIKISKV